MAESLVVGREWSPRLERVDSLAEPVEEPCRDGHAGRDRNRSGTSRHDGTGRERERSDEQRQQRDAHGGGDEPVEADLEVHGSRTQRDGGEQGDPEGADEDRQGEEALDDVVTAAQGVGEQEVERPLLLLAGYRARSCADGEDEAGRAAR